MIDPCYFCNSKECPEICYKRREYLFSLLKKEVKQEGKSDEN